MLSLFLMAEETTAPKSSKQDFICHGCHFRIPMSGILKILWAQLKKVASIQTAQGRIDLWSMECSDKKHPPTALRIISRLS